MAMKKLSDEFVLSVGMLLTAFLIFQAAIIPGMYNKDQTAAVFTSKKDSFEISPSKSNPKVFSFEYKFETLKSGKEAYFDIPIRRFDDKRTSLGADNEIFGNIRDAWNYPVRENAFMNARGGGEKRGGDDRSDEDPDVLGQVNCRANTDIDGYFKAYFEDVALGNGVGYADQIFGEARRNEVCQVLQDISELINLDETDVTPDIIFMADPGNIPPNALAGASSYFNNASIGPDNGFLHRHIISEEDPTPADGMFDAYVVTNFNGISWDVDTDLNPGTYDMYSVLYHEILHALGFRGLLPAVITNSGSTFHHDTFDSFSFKDDSLADQFIDPSDFSLDVFNGAPSPWFVTNDVVYRGTRNLDGAVPDGIRPIYSPIGWQQGSSLSHFDMARANGEVYVMHPSIGTNTERSIHEHEKEVLCHLGYVVEGVSGCEDATPWAENDVAALQTGSAICIEPLLNDFSLENGTVRLNEVIPIDIQAGDVIAYHSTVNCTGAPLPDADWARTILFESTSNDSVRLLAYRDRDTASDRLSNQAIIKIVGDCSNDPDEYVCNGDFEMTTAPNDAFISCPNGWDPFISATTYWCNAYDDGAYVLSANQQMDIVVPENDDYIADVNPLPWAFSNKLRQPLVAGEDYILSFDMWGHMDYIPPALIIGLNMEPLVGHTAETWYADAESFPDQTIPVTQLGEPISQTILNVWWDHYEIPFTANDNYESLIFGSDIYKLFLDNISIKRADIFEEGGLNTVQGKVYYDLNSNGQLETGESGLSGITVGIFPLGSTIPLATTTTEDGVNLGEYVFENMPDNVYRMVLMDESVFPSVTEPASNSLLPGYNHAVHTYIVDGETSEGNDFGVTLEVGQMPNIHLKKGLADSSLSLIDRNITWQIEATNTGEIAAHNVNISDPIPLGLIYYSHVTPSPNIYSPDTHIWNLPVVQSGQTIVLQITMKVPLGTCGKKDNTANLVSLNEVDSDPADNVASATIKLRPCGNQIESVK